MLSKQIILCCGAHSDVMQRCWILASSQSWLPQQNDRVAGKQPQAQHAQNKGTAVLEFLVHLPGRSLALTADMARCNACLTVLLIMLMAVKPPPATSSLVHHCCQLDEPDPLPSSPLLPVGRLCPPPPPPPVTPPVFDPPSPPRSEMAGLPPAVAVPLAPKGMLSMTIVALLSTAVAAPRIGCRPGLR